MQESLVAEFDALVKRKLRNRIAALVVADSVKALTVSIQFSSDSSCTF